LKILAEDPITAHIPVVALSANAMPHDIEKGLQAGFVRYLCSTIPLWLLPTMDVTAQSARDLFPIVRVGE
jgi:CheY-like chemotaxis protein